MVIGRSLIQTVLVAERDDFFRFVERSLLDQIPELTEIRDATDHSFAENAYYR